MEVKQGEGTFDGGHGYDLLIMSLWMFIEEKRGFGSVGFKDFDGI
jgi:hypothetical protein